jgi:DNA polymerase III subunit epsilon
MLTAPPRDRTFVAIDFETADYPPESACAVGLVRVEHGCVVDCISVLMRPPRPWVRFTHIHGITWEMVRGEPSFAEVWPQLLPMLDGAELLVAHNAGFDRGVLEACCRRAGLAPPDLPFGCTVRMARSAWKERRNDLASVSARLGISLKHHDALSDALACARIAIAAGKHRP